MTTSAPSRARSTSVSIRIAEKGWPSVERYPFRKSEGISVGGAHRTTWAPMVVRPHRLERATRL